MSTLKLYGKDCLINLIKYGEGTSYNKNTARQDMYDFIDNILITFNKKEITVLLNELQDEMYTTLGSDIYNKSKFSLKYTIPLYFVNLYLKRYNLSLIEEDMNGK